MMNTENQIIEKKEVNPQIVNLTFDCYEFFKFIETIEKYVDEVEIVFENKECTIGFMDLSRIMLCKCTISLHNYSSKNMNYHSTFLLDKMTFGLNTKDLMELLRTRKSDKKEIEITFDNTKTFIQLVKTSTKHKSIITRTLALLELDLETIPMDNLNAIIYPSKAIFPTEYLDDFFYESSKFSEIVEIDIDDSKGISFNEEGTIGTSNYLIKSENCNEIEGKEKGSYSYTFLTPIKPLLPILTNSDITIHIKNDHPIKLELRIESLDIDMLVYLAPRVEEEDYSDYDDNDF